MSTASKLPFSKFAVFTSEPTPRRKNVVELRRDKFDELKAKKAIDRANAVLDRLEARVSSYDAQLQEILDLFVKPLQKRKANAQSRIDQLEEKILAKLSEANLERADGFHRYFQQHPCPKAVTVDNPALIPHEYLRNKPDPDKVLIKSALERDKDLQIPGVHLTQKVSLVRK